MAHPPLSDLESSAKKIVWRAKKEGKLKEYTPRIIRQMLEKEYELAEGTLDEAEFKSAIKSAVKAAASEPAPSSEDEMKVEKTTKPTSSSRKKRKSDEITKTTTPSPSTKSKGKSKAKGSPIGKSQLERDRDDNGVIAKKRKVSVAKKAVSSEDEEEKSTPPPPRPKNRQRKSKQDSIAYKSAEHVATSDMEQDAPVPKYKESVSPNAKTSSKPEISKSGPSKYIKEQDISMADPGDKSESELSVLIDEPPKRKRNSSSGTKSTKPPAKPRAKKDTPAPTKDEETIKKLKGLVVACGVRKVWSKVFQDLDTPQQQIRKLKEILAELGMTGRMTMEQARAIKEKREFAQELEDVQAFAKAIEGRSSRSRASTSKQEVGNHESEEEANEGDSDEDDAPKKRSGNTRKSIMAFLQDQSSDED